MRSLNTSSLSQAQRTVYERSTFKWSGTLTDQDGAAIAAADMTTVTCSVTDAKTGTKLVDGRNILNANNGTLSSGGAQTVILTGDDNRLVGVPAGAVEIHWLTIDYTWLAGARRRWHVVELHVVNHPGIG